MGSLIIAGQRIEDMGPKYLDWTLTGLDATQHLQSPPLLAAHRQCLHDHLHSEALSGDIFTCALSGHFCLRITVPGHATR